MSVVIRAVLFFPLRLLVVWPLRLGWLAVKYGAIAFAVIAGWAALIILLT